MERARLSTTNSPKSPVKPPKKINLPAPSAGGGILLRMTPQIARLYDYVLPVFWPYLWLQLRWIFKRQDEELRTLLISVTKWGHVSIVYVGDHWRAYRKPKAIRASWDDPSWESHIAPNMACVFLEESQTLLAPNPSAPNADILPLSRGNWPEGTEGGLARADTS